MTGIQKSFVEIVDDFNISAQTEFNKQYKEYSPALKEFAFKFSSGDVPDVPFLINLLFGGIEEWKGTQEYDKVDEVIEQLVINKEWFIRGIEIEHRKFRRAVAANSISGLDMYIKGIGNFAKKAQDGPFRRMLELLAAGTGTTLGTCFDNEPLFSTSHAFDKVAGTQSNLRTGTGTTTAQISDDLKAAMADLIGFFYTIDNNSTADEDKRSLNEDMMRFVVLCDPSLSVKMKDVRTLENIVIDSNGGTQTNTLRNTFEIVTRHFADPNDYYVIDVSDPSVKPFLISMEQEGKLITPQDNQEALANLQTLRYAFNQLSFGNAYGAWWKIVKVNN